MYFKNKIKNRGHSINFAVIWGLNITNVSVKTCHFGGLNANILKTTNNILISLDPGLDRYILSSTKI